MLEYGLRRNGWIARGSEFHTPIMANFYTCQLVARFHLGLLTIPMTIHSTRLLRCEPANVR